MHTTRATPAPSNARTICAPKNPVAPVTSTASRTKAPAIEIHVGAWCEALAQGRKSEADAEWRAIKEGATLARGLGLEVHAGHGLDRVQAIDLDCDEVIQHIHQITV